jgi:bacterioferritin (cytochrome b1)
MSAKERQEQVVESLKRWQKVEKAAVNITGKIIEKTDHPLIQMVAETIQRDSTNHYHVQKMIIDSLETKPLTLSPDDLADVWDLIKEHNEIEKKTIDLANEAIEGLKGQKHLTAQIYLLKYILKDEEKHNDMLEALEQVKKDIYPYA